MTSLPLPLYIQYVLDRQRAINTFQKKARADHEELMTLQRPMVLPSSRIYSYEEVLQMLVKRQEEIKQLTQKIDEHTKTFGTHEQCLETLAKTYDEAGNSMVLNKWTEALGYLKTGSKVWKCTDNDTDWRTFPIKDCYYRSKETIGWNITFPSCATLFCVQGYSLDIQPHFVPYLDDIPDEHQLALINHLYPP